MRLILQSSNARNWITRKKFAFLQQPFCKCIATSTLLFPLLSQIAIAQNLAPANPYLTDSYYPSVHGIGGGNVSAVDGPTSKSRRINQDELFWSPSGLFDLTTMAYSGLYPDGRRTLLVGSTQRLVKLDADTLETLSTYVLNPGNYISAEESTQRRRTLNRLFAEKKRQEMIDLAAELVTPQITDEHLGNTFTSLTREHERLMFVKDPYSKKRYYRIIGDAIEGDAGSNLVVKRQWEIPEFNGRPFIPFGSGMTYDGWNVAVSDTGMMLAFSNDFKKYTTLDLAAYADNPEEIDRSFMRNGIVIDDQNGVYVNAADFLVRVQWTGSELSLDPKLGAWMVKYSAGDAESAAAPSGAKGSGTTPSLMGWGEDEDHLVVIADADDSDPKMMVLWRDKIPDDWQGIPGYDRRVAGTAPVMFQPGIRPLARIENSPIVKGYGIFTAAELPSKIFPKQDTPVKDWIATRVDSIMPGSEAIGGIKWVWDSKTRELKVDWITPLKLGISLCAPSINGFLYCMTIENGSFTLVALDWVTGEPKRTYKLGKDLRHFSSNNMVIAPNGAVDIFNWLGLGINRIQPDSLKP